MSIGKSVLIADNVYISDNLHTYKDLNMPIKSQKINYKGATNIGEHSWIGEKASIIGAFSRKTLCYWSKLSRY